MVGEVGISPVIRANSGLHAELLLLLTICFLLGESKTFAIAKRCRGWVIYMYIYFQTKSPSISNTLIYIYIPQ